VEAGQDREETAPNLFGFTPPSRLESLERSHRTDERLSVEYDALVNSALGGDGNAAMTLGLSLAICSHAPSSRDQLEDWVGHVQTTGLHPKLSIRLGDPAAQIEQFRRDFEYCQGISRDQLLEYASWIRTAANLGNLEALTEFVDSVGVDTEIRAAAEAAIWSTPAAKLDDLIHAKRLAAQAGSANALVAIGQLALRGKIPELSRNEAIGYYVAGIAAKNAGMQEAEISTQRASQLMNSVSPSNLAEIREVVEGLLEDEDCCFFFNPRTGDDLR
jgi:TPR repeat protein